MPELKKPIIRHKDDPNIPTEKLPFGQLQLVTSAQDNPDLNVVYIVADQKDQPHFHPQGTELYIVVEGRGKILTGKKEETPTDESLRPGSVVMIPSNFVHQLIPHPSSALGVPMRIWVVSNPAWIEDNEVKVPEWGKDV